MIWFGKLFEEVMRGLMYYIPQRWARHADDTQMEACTERNNR